MLLKKKKKNLSTWGFFFLLTPPSFPSGKMSDVRTVRKRQQLNNLVTMVTELARPGNTIVDFCSGTVRSCMHACLFTTEPMYSHMVIELHE